jgi:flagellar hook protein FlgE
VSGGEVLNVTVGSNSFSLTFGTGGGQISTVAELQTALAAYPATMGTATADTNGNLTFTASGTNTVIVSPAATAAKFGINVFTAYPANGTVLGQDSDAFLNESLGGGAITAFDISGSPVNIQLRWAKVDSSAYGGTDTWNLFYLVNSSATGTQPPGRMPGSTIRSVRMDRCRRQSAP